MTSEDLCPCGLPLHYASPDLQVMVERLIADLGTNIPVTCKGLVWQVPRHYIALHGIKGTDLAEVGEKLGFEKMERSAG